MEVMRAMLDRLRPTGVLVTGKQESLPSLIELLEPFAPHSGIYRQTGTV